MKNISRHKDENEVSEEASLRFGDVPVGELNELSLNILDIAENSVAAGATRIEIELQETEETLSVTVSDNGCGMTADELKMVTDPSFTTRLTRQKGLGVPLFKLAAEKTGGEFYITSRSRSEFLREHGTVTGAIFRKDSIHFVPLGDIVAAVRALITGNDEIDFLFTHEITTEHRKASVKLDTAELRSRLGDVSAFDPDILIMIGNYLTEQYKTE